MKKLALGVDIGGSHITCQLFDLDSNKLVENSQKRVCVDGNGSKESILESWVYAIKEALAEINLYDLAGIGFAMPGPFDYPKGIAWFDQNVGKFHNLHGVDVKNELLKRLEFPADFPIRFLNDAASFAVGEANVDAMSGFNRILVLTLGTGFGSTFLENKVPVAGKYGVPDDGFLYHIPFKNGIADEHFSTRWFLNEYKNSTGETVSGVKDLVDRFETDKSVQKLFTEFGENLGQFLVSWIQKFEAECVILGGNISKSMALFLPEMKKKFAAENLTVEMFPSKLNEDAALIGSAKLCDDNYYSKLINQ
ncbi:ROK family protein [Prolixibacteraceae bacterium Z1-6]|uniref:ROK family protein n=1 Tax=Draconibacterium aestuarii TaxID=2998507 RepID=A0A9X3FGU0_9BACT|nr:ROK family protein [Prolixibacteraceae bacterium Z1-6]